MPEAKDTQLIEGLIRATQEGKVRWIPTAKLREFTTSFLGKFSVVVAETPPSAGEASPSYELTLSDETSGTVLDRIVGPSVGPLLELAQSNLHADRDRAIDDILEELDQRTVNLRRRLRLDSKKAG